MEIYRSFACQLWFTGIDIRQSKLINVLSDPLGVAHFFRKAGQTFHKKFRRVSSAPDIRSPQVTVHQTALKR